MSAADASVLNVVVRMVVPMRREFGRALDVQQFMHDREYARAVLAQALASQDARLREHALYVQRHLMGARGVVGSSAGPPPTPASRAPAPPPPASELPTSELPTSPMPLAPVAPGHVPAAPAAPATPAATSTATPPATAPAETSEAELRARLLKKYTGGLR